MQIIQQIRLTREAAGLTQDVVSARTGIAVSNLSTIENGKVDVRLSTLMRILDALDLELKPVPRAAPITLESVVRNAADGRARLEAAGMAQSDPRARLDAKELRGIDVRTERALLRSGG